MLTSLFIAIAAAALIFHTMAFFATRRHMRSARAALPEGELPGVSLIKPLRGEEEELEQNLRSFFELDYAGPMEILFAVADIDDPAMQVAKRVAAEYSQVRTRFLHSDRSFGRNPKVANMAAAVDAAQHELLFQTDANTRMEPSSLSALVGEMLATDAALVSAVVVGNGEQSAGAALENVQLGAYIAPAMCLALDFDVHCVCGKAMLVQRKDLQAVGGIGAFRNILCEDFVLGERLKEHGKSVRLSAVRVHNINRDCGFRQFFTRHSRWLKMRAVLHVGGFAADLFANPLPFLLAAVVADGFSQNTLFVATAIYAAKIATELMSMRLLRTLPPLKFWWLGIVRDAALVPMWVYAIFSRSVSWRGTKLYFGRHTLLFPPSPSARQALVLSERKLG